MSGKRAKEKRRENKKPSTSILINFYPDGKMDIDGFPLNFTMAMRMMQAATSLIADTFMRKAVAGDLDEKLNIKQSPVIQKNKSLFGPDGRPLQ